MNFSWKRFLSMVLAIVMVVGMVPFGALDVYAAETTYQVGDVVKTPNNAAPADQPNAVWVANGDNAGFLEECAQGYRYEHTHDDTCYKLDCDHKDGHWKDCFATTTAYDECKHSEDSQHSGYVDIWALLELDLSDRNEPIKFKDHEASPIAKAKYDDLFNNGGCNKKHFFMKCKGINAILNHYQVITGMKICYTVAEGEEPICGHVHSEVGGSCYKLNELTCGVKTLGKYEEHTHKETDSFDTSCYVYTWTLCADVNNNDKADGTDADPYFTVTYKNGENEVQKTENLLGGDKTPAGPVLEDQELYTFGGWGEVAETVTGTVTYTAKWTPKNDAANNNGIADEEESFNVTFVNYDGTVLQATETLAYGTMPEYKGETPVREADAQYTYTFTGWTPAIDKVTGDVTYTAQFGGDVNSYTITFVNEDGTELWSETLEYGATPEYKGEKPTKAAEVDDNGVIKGTYSHNGWTEAITTVEGNKTYIAKFDYTPATYTVTWLVNGVEFDTASGEYGVAVTAPTNTPASYDGGNGLEYVFEKWDAEAPATFAGNVTINAVFKLEGAVAKIGEKFYGSLALAVKAANEAGGATITLVDNVTLGEKLTISGNVTIEGDYTITRDVAYTGTLFTVNSGATLTLDGGLTIDGGNNYAFDKDAFMADANSRVKVETADSAKWFTLEEGAPVATAFMITTTGGTVNLNDVTIQNNYSTNSGVISADANSTINLTGAKITHIASTQGNGVVANVSGANIVVTVNDGTIIDGNHVGSNHGIFKIYSGAKVVMYGGEITNNTGWNSNGVVAGIYWGTLELKGGKICSNAGVSGPNNGRNAAIYGHSGHTFVMTGGTICHNTGGYAGLDAPYSNGKTEISGGAIVNNISASGNSYPDVNASAALVITGGTFTQDVSKWLAPDCGLVYNPETGVFAAADDIAEVNGVQYTSLAEAVAAANNGDTVKVLASHKLYATVVIDKNITLDLNGMNLLATDGVNPMVRILADVTVTGNGMIDIANQGDGYCFIVGNGEGVSGNLTIENGTFNGTTTAVSVTKGTATILDGDFRIKAYTDENGNAIYDYLLNCIDANYKDGSAQIIVKGGKFTNFNPADNAAEGANTDFVHHSCKVVDNGDGTWTVVKKAIYTITFVFGNGTENKVEKVYEGDSFTAPADPAWENHVFVGWDGNIVTTPTADTTYTAQWFEDFNGNEIDDATEAHFTITYLDGKGNELKKFEDVLVGVKMPTIADPTLENFKFNGWDPAVAEFVTADATYTAQWLNDNNNNGVDDTEETVTVTINGNGTVNNNTETFTVLYDSTTETTVSINAVPVINEGNSKSYVSSITANGAELELNYDAYCVTLDAPVEGNNIVVTFTDCGFVKDEDGKMRFYVGMEAPDYETLYKAVMVSPEYIEGVVTAQYLARPAGTYTFEIPVLFEKSIFGQNIKIGGTTESVDLNDAWLDVGENFKTLTADQLQQLYNEEIEGIKAKIAAIDLSDLSWSNVGEKVRQFLAIREELSTLINTIKTEAQYLGYHQFGASSLTDENGNAQEILKVIFYNGAMRLEDEEVYVTLVDDRTETTITGGNLTFEYDEFTDEDIMNALVLTDVDGNVIEGELSKYIVLADSNVGEHTYTVYYEGNWDYKPCTVEFTLNVIKAPSNTDVLNHSITYGEDYNANPIVTNKHGKEIDIDTIEFIVGLDISELDVDGDGIKGLTGKAQLILTDELQTILSMVGLENGAEMNINDLIGALSNTGLLEQWGVTGEMVDTLNQALNAINGIVENNNLMITIGGGYPTNVGAYLHGAVTVDGNYETSVDVGYIIIKPTLNQVYLDWNYHDNNGVFTWALLEQIDIHASAFNDAELTDKNAEISEFVHELFFGIDEQGNVVAELDTITNGDQLGTGAFLELAFVAEFGNETYYAIPIVRPVVVVPNAIHVDIVGADENGVILREFNNEPQNVEVNVTLDGVNLNKDYLTVNYVGIQTNTKTYNSTVAPTQAGAYAVTATYLEKNENGDIIGVGLDMAVLVIEPTTSTIDVAEKVVTVDGDKSYDLEETLVTVGSTVPGLKPDTTIISAQISTDGTYSENGWDAINGSVNVDFPAWVDALIAEHAPSVVDGITMGQLKDKLLNKLPSITAKLLEIGATEEIANSFNNLINNVVKAMENIPEDVKLTFNDDVTAKNVGAYAVIGVVTDSDHYPAIDAGILVIVPDVAQVHLNWNYQDENGIWTRELLNHVDLLATAFDDEAFSVENAAATAKISYQFIGMNKNGEMVIYQNADELVNGAYIELAYIELEVDGKIYISDMIARSIVVIPYGAEVTFVDETGAENNDRVFTYDSTGKTMPVQITVNGKVITPAEGSVTYSYVGVLANGEEYKSNIAPVDVGIYTVVATYQAYGENGSMTVFGSAAGVMAIQPAELTVTVNNQEKVYGDVDPELTYDVTGLGQGDTLDVVITREQGENVGEYTITATVAEDPNYIINVVPGTLTITKKAITVTADDASKVYGTEDPAFTSTIEGLVGEDTLNVTFTREEGENVGEYTINATVAEDPNYIINVVPGTLTITKKAATITITPVTATMVAGNTVPEFSAVVEGTINGDELVYTINTVDGKTAGQYSIGAELGNNPNYDVTVVPATLVVEVAVAKINDVYYASLQTAIDEVKNGETIVLLTTIDEDVIIEQTAGKSFTIDGNDQTYTGTMKIDGNKRNKGAETLSIKNVNFVAHKNMQVSIDTVKNTSVHNLTVEGCTFTGIEAAEKTAYGMILRNANNVVVKNTEGTGLFDLVYGNRAVTGFIAENVTVTDSTNGIVLSYVNSTAAFKNLNLDVVEKGVAFLNNVKGTVAIEDSTIKAKIPVYLAQNNETFAFTINLEGSNTLTSTNDGALIQVIGTDAMFKVVDNDTALDLDMVKTEGLVAKIGNTYYNSLANAVKDAKDDDTIVIIKDHELTWNGKTVVDGSLASMVVVSGKSVTIDLNGKNLTVDANKMNGTDLYAVFAADEGGSLTMKDTAGNGSVKATGVAFAKSNTTAYSMLMAYEAGTSLTVESGTYYMESAHDSLIYSGADKAVTVNDGNFTLGNVGYAPVTGNNGKPWIFNVLGANDRTTIVNGGTYNADIDDRNYQYWQYEVTLPEDKCCVDNDDGTWTVKAHPAGVPVVENEVAPTCTADGSYDNVVYCTECGKELSRETVVVPALGHTAGAAAEEVLDMNNDGIMEGVYEVTRCSVCGEIISAELIAEYVCWDTVDRYWTDLSDALDAVDNDAAETIEMLKDYEEKYVIIAPGTTLDLDDHTVTARFVVGMNGSYLTGEYVGTATPAQLVVDVDNITLSEECHNDGSYDVLPIYNPNTQSFQFSRFQANTDKSKDPNRGLKVDTEKKEIYFQFVTNMSGAARRTLLNDGASDNELSIVIRMTWESETGYAKQDFVFKDEHIAMICAGGKDFYVTLTNYDELGINIDTLEVQGMIITNSGAVSAGDLWTK